MSPSEVENPVVFSCFQRPRGENCGCKIKGALGDFARRHADHKYKNYHMVNEYQDNTSTLGEDLLPVERCLPSFNEHLGSLLKNCPGPTA